MTDKVNQNSADLQGEVWKPVVGYEGFYEVSNMGRVRSVTHTDNGRWGVRLYKGVVLKQSNRTAGSKNSPFYYKGVSLHKNGVSKNMNVHRLVAEAFIPNPHNFPIVNHIDENPSNNRVENLEWCTQKHNQNHGTLPERRRQLRYKKVNQYGLDGKFVKQFQSVIEASEAMGLIHSSISNACKGYAGTAGGYLWRYENSSNEELDITAKWYDSLCRQMVVQLTQDGEFVALYNSSRSAAKAIKRSSSRICDALKESNKTAGGYKWMRYSDYKARYPERTTSFLKVEE